MGIVRLAWISVAVLAVGAVTYGVGCVTDTGDPCSKYCADIMATCTGNDQVYPDVPTCTRFCESINARDAGNDSIQCRQLNVSTAKDEPDPALKHAECLGGGISATNCGPSACADFCATDLALCSGSNSQYASQSACEAACAKWDPSVAGQLLGSTGDSLNCRTYHLELSQTGQSADLITHCPHTGDPSPRCTAGDGGTAEGGTDGGTSDAASDAPLD